MPDAPPLAEIVPTLTDGVVTLRAHRADDARRVFEQSQDPRSQAFTSIPVPYTHDDARAFVGEIVPGCWAAGSEWIFALEVDGRFGGSMSLRNDGDRRAELAFGSHPDVRGTGAMERGVRLLLEWGFASRDLAVVTWLANVGNWGSRSLAHRVGFSLDGTVRRMNPQRGELHDTWIGTLLPGEPMRPAQPWLRNPVVEGDGVRLRPFTDADVPRVVEGLGDRETQHWLAFLPRDPGEAEGRAYLETVRERLASRHTITWAVCSPDDERLLGVVGLYRVDAEPEVGYWTHPDARGRGITTRAAALAARHGFEELGLDRLAAYASAHNTASRRVLEAIGMRQAGVGRLAARTGDGTAVDLVGYDLLPGELATTG